MPGTNSFLTEYSQRHGLPPVTARGGAKTMYPEYAIEVDRLSKGETP